MLGLEATFQAGDGPSGRWVVGAAMAGEAAVARTAIVDAMAARSLVLLPLTCRYRTLWPFSTGGSPGARRPAGDSQLTWIG